MATDDLAFLEAAYTSMLGRAVDPMSLREGLRALAAGEPRWQLVRRLRASEEALRRSLCDPRLAPATAERLLTIGPAARFVEQARLALGGNRPDAATVARDVARLSALGDRQAWLRERLAEAGPRTARLPDAHLIELDAGELNGTVRAELPRLMAVSDAAFVHLAYWRLLGRAPDTEGALARRKRLARGARRADVLHEMIASPEGIRCGASLAGLDSARSLAGRVSRWTLTGVKQAWQRLQHGSDPLLPPH